MTSIDAGVMSREARGVPASWFETLNANSLTMGFVEAIVEVAIVGMRSVESGRQVEAN